MKPYEVIRISESIDPHREATASVGAPVKPIRVSERGVPRHVRFTELAETCVRFPVLGSPDDVPGADAWRMEPESNWFIG